jgi:hypothetical protein
LRIIIFISVPPHICSAIVRKNKEHLFLGQQDFMKHTAPDTTPLSQEQGLHVLRGFSIESQPDYQVKVKGDSILFNQERNLELESSFSSQED